MATALAGVGVGIFILSRKMIRKNRNRVRMLKKVYFDGSEGKPAFPSDIEVPSRPGSLVHIYYHSACTPQSHRQVSKKAVPLPMSTVAAKAGIKPDEFFMYGNHKAKVGR